MFIRPHTWKAFITNHHSTEENNKSFHLIYEAFNKEKSIFECINAALGMYPGIFLAFPIDAPRPILIHHLNRALRNPIDHNDVDEFYGLISWDNGSLAIKLDPSNLFALAGDGTLDEEGILKNYFRDLNTAQLFNARDTRAFGSVQELDQNEKMYMRRCIPIPPFIALMMTEHIENENAHQLGTRVASFIGDIEQDTFHILHETVTSVAGRTALKSILAWLQKAQTCLDLRIVSNQVFTGSKIDKLAKVIKYDKLMELDQTRDIDQNNITHDMMIQSNVAIMQELIESRRITQENNNSSGKKGFQKLPSAIQAFLLAVGSHDLENPIESITKTGLELLKMSQKHAVDELSRLLKKERKEDTNLDMAHMMEIISIKWFASHNPFIGLSLCRMPPASKFSAASAFEKAEKLELQKELEIEKSEIMHTLTDRSLYRPLIIDDLLSNVSIIQGIIELYLGAESMLVQRIADFHHEIRRNKSKIKHILASDDTILTKIQYVFDTRLNTWLEETYESADNLLDIDHELINFTSIVRTIIYGTFTAELPLNLLPSAPTKKRPALSNDEEKDGQKQKKKKGEVNNNIINEFKLKDGENWSMFTKDPNNLRPSSVCMMFHILGHCPQGKNCKRAKSHETLTEIQKQQTIAFIEDRRK